MRLVFLSNVHPNPVSPRKGTFNGALVRALGEQHEVHVICPISWMDQLRSGSKSLTSAAVPAKAVRLQPSVTASYPTFWYPPLVWRSHYDRFLNWSLQRRVRRELAAFQPDAVLSYWAHPDGTVAVDFARQLGIPAVTMVGGSDVLLLGQQGARRKVILNTLRRSDAVIAVSADIAQRVTADGVSPRTVHVVRRGVESAVFSPGDRRAARTRLGLPLDQQVVVGVGRLVPVKDWTTLVEACGVLRQTGHAPRCYLLGDGPLHTTLQQQLERLGLGDHVRLMGSQSQSDLADWYRAADLVVLPSLSEGVPNVLLEAIACGTPFVATRVGGIPEIADPIQHRLVPPRQPAALAAAIREKLNAAPAPSRLKVAPFTWRESAEQVAAIVAGCVEHRRGESRASSRDSTSLAADAGLRGRDLAASVEIHGGSPV